MASTAESTVGSLLKSPLMWLVVIGVGYYLISGSSLGNLISTAIKAVSTLLDGATAVGGCIVHPIDCPQMQWLYKETAGAWNYYKNKIDSAGEDIKSGFSKAGEDIKGGFSKAGNWVSTEAQDTGSKISHAAKSVQTTFLNAEHGAAKDLAKAGSKVTDFASHFEIHLGGQHENALGRFGHREIDRIKAIFSWL